MIYLLLISLIEYVVHRFIMHKYIYQHKVLHHAIYYRIFNFEANAKGKYLDLKIGWLYTIILLIIILPLAYFSWTDYLIFSVMWIVHNRVWDAFHSEMHLNEGKFFSNWPIFLLLKRWHQTHHKYVNSNFGALLPIWDFIFCTAKIGNPIIK